MRTIARTTAQIDANDNLSYLLVGGGALALIAAVVAAIAG